LSEHAASAPIATHQPQILSTEAFLHRVHALKPRLAVFDCDGTLWSGDAGSNFMGWTMETGLLSPEKTAWLKSRYDGYRAGAVSELAICGEMVQVYAGIPIAEMRRAAATFFAERIERHIFPEMAGLLADLQRTGVEIWAVSSTCDWVIEEGVKRFSIPPERVLAARVAPDGLGDAAIATSRLLDVPTDEGKVASLHRVGITAPDAVFGNSVHDYAMLAIARAQGPNSGAFPVNPSAELQRRSAERGWPVFWPESVRPIS
jgi:phosphoserine phosphatase